MMKDNPALAANNRGPLTELDQVFVKDGERCWFVKLGEIRLFESVGNYAKVYFGTHKPLILKSLNALEERLDVALSNQLYQLLLLLIRTASRTHETLSANE